jgi:hypothetical protein
MHITNSVVNVGQQRVQTQGGPQGGVAAPENMGEPISGTLDLGPPPISAMDAPAPTSGGGDLPPFQPPPADAGLGVAPPASSIGPVFDREMGTYR